MVYRQEAGNRGLWMAEGFAGNDVEMMISNRRYENDFWMMKDCLISMNLGEMGILTVPVDEGGCI